AVDPDRVRSGGLERHVPYAAGQAECHVSAADAVMKQGVPADEVEVADAEPMEVDGIVDPFLDHVALENGGGENTAHGGGGPGSGGGAGAGEKRRPATTGNVARPPFTCRPSHGRS